MIQLYTAIALVVDRSGSMHSVADDTKGSVQNLIQTQKQQEGQASLTLIQFDHEYQVIHDCADLQTVDEEAFAKQYQPRGSTALVDAIGRTIINMSNKIETMEQKPTKVIVAVVTDGFENASREFTTEKVKQLVEEKQNLGWEFIFLGADLNAIHSAQSYGFSPKGSAYYHNGNVSQAFDTLNSKISDARQGKTIEITEEERNYLKDVLP